MIEDIRGKRSSRREPVNNDEPSFVPPEAVAEEEEVIDMADQAPSNKKSAPAGKPTKKRNLLSAIGYRLSAAKTWLGKRSKKQKIAIILVLLLLLGGIGYGAYSIFKSEPAPAPVVEKKEEVKEPPKPTTEASKLTGVSVAIELNKLPVTGIMIENSPDARPQSGLRDAGVVFEAIAEGGITRFLALFQESQPDYIGPVRSVRAYYLSWLKAFDAPIAHAGGSANALEKIRNEGFKDLDQAFNAGSYQRINSRYAPHNLYTSRANLLNLQTSKGWTSSSFTGFARKAEAPVVPAVARAIDIAISGPLYNTHYDYDVASNSYLRSQAGAPHIDERSGAQINPKVVIAMVIPYGIHPNGVNSEYGTIGSGTAYIFQDGNVTQGTWSKASDEQQVLFGDASGAPLGLNPGQTWITMVNTPTNITYVP